MEGQYDSLAFTIAAAADLIPRFLGSGLLPDVKFSFLIEIIKLLAKPLHIEPKAIFFFL